MDKLQRMMNLFRGQDRGYGTYDLTGSVVDKVTGKNVAVPYKIATVKQPVTADIWAGHLNGESAIGIIPIRDDSTCYFGAIDVDIYKDFDSVSFIKNIYNKGLPLVPCRSKSGGLHLYLFLKDAAPAEMVRKKLQAMAGFLGQGDAEIFPKQDTVLADRGDMLSLIHI